VARWLSDRCPLGEVTATDLNTCWLDIATLPANLVVRRHDVRHEDFPPAAFDLVHARWVLSHLPERERVLERIVRWVRPGGWLVVEDLTDFPAHSSPHERFRRVVLAMSAVVRGRVGTDPYWARHFPEPLRRLSLNSIGVEASVPVVGGGNAMSRFWRHTIDQLADDLCTTSGISTADLEALYVDLFSDHFTDFVAGSITMWGRRPMNQS
jgi:SAM-dependent methyltransferase